jgi:hypothetical protein
MKLSRKEKQAKKKLIGVYKQCIDVMTRYMEPVAVISTTKKGGTQITSMRFPDYHYKKIIRERIQKVTAELNSSQG